MFMSEEYLSKYLVNTVNKHTHVHKPQNARKHSITFFFLYDSKWYQIQVLTWKFFLLIRSFQVYTILIECIGFSVQLSH